jgi:hypothetical protein
MQFDIHGLFKQDGCLTEEALEACKFNEIDAEELMPRLPESFKRAGLPLDAINKLYQVHKKKRQGLMHLVAKHISISKQV